MNMVHLIRLGGLPTGSRHARGGFRRKVTVYIDGMPVSVPGTSARAVAMVGANIPARD